MRIVYLGMLGTLSALPFESLLASGADIKAVIVPSASAGEPLQELTHARPLAGLGLQPVRANLLELARAHGVPGWSVSALRDPESLARLRLLRPELLIVSCFRYILPATWLAVPAHGAWNLHPSLLPRLRGPDPLFWTLHDGAPPGVSVHRMTVRVDAGPILAQTPLDFADGIHYADAERICARAGSELFCRALGALERGTLIETIQDEAEADYRPLPARSDFVVTAEWQVRRAFNFLRAVADMGAPRLLLAGREFVVRQAVDFSAGATLSEPFCLCGDTLAARLADGVLRVLYFAPES